MYIGLQADSPSVNRAVGILFAIYAGHAAAGMMPVTNPFLREMLQTFLKAGGRKGGIDFDELGLASTVTWREMAKSRAGLNIPEGTNSDQPFVQILDPATGTATFLVEVIDVVHRHLKVKWEKSGIGAMPHLPPSNWKQKPDSFQTWWNQYVALSLLPRLHGYKVSRGSADATLVEFKLASNSKLKQNLKHQVGVYEAANDTATSIKAILYFSASELTRVQTILKELDLAGRRDVVLIDARPDNKALASNVRDE